MGFILMTDETLTSRPRAVVLPTGASMGSYENLPAELRNLRHWVCYRLEKRKQLDDTWKNTKVPCELDGTAASSTDPATWNSFESCVGAVGTSHIAGIGFVFSKAAGFTGIDLDKCRDPQSGVTELWASAIIDEISS
jgi:putative DNA primase/helicase